MSSVLTLLQEHSPGHKISSFTAGAACLENLTPKGKKNADETQESPPASRNAESTAVLPSPSCPHTPAMLAQSSCHPGVPSVPYEGPSVCILTPG